MIRTAIVVECAGEPRQWSQRDWGKVPGLAGGVLVAHRNNVGEVLESR